MTVTPVSAELAAKLKVLEARLFVVESSSLAVPRLAHRNMDAP